jgi:hypothetical protein
MRCNEKWAGQEQARRKQVETPHGPTMGIRSQSCHPHTKVGLVFPLNNDIVRSGQCKVKTTENGEIGTKEARLFLASAFVLIGWRSAGGRQNMQCQNCGHVPGPVRSFHNSLQSLQVSNFKASTLGAQKIRIWMRSAESK